MTVLFRAAALSAALVLSSVAVASAVTTGDNTKPNLDLSSKLTKIKLVGGQTLYVGKTKIGRAHV